MVLRLEALSGEKKLLEEAVKLAVTRGSSICDAPRGKTQISQLLILAHPAELSGYTISPIYSFS